MTPEQAHALRAPFPAEKIGKLPRVTCGKCRDSRDKACDQHSKAKCADCHNWITSAHIHLDFVGHADATDRFLEVDPGWTWEPFALDAKGLPAVDDNGGMWLRLTIAGVTRIGYGDSDGKRGPSAVKEAIGDGLRNAGMRFGVALDLWRKEPVTEEQSPARRRSQPKPPAEPEPTAEELVNQAQHRKMQALWRDLGFGGEHNRDNRLRITAKIVGMEELVTSASLTARQAAQVITALEERKRLMDEEAANADVTAAV